MDLPMKSVAEQHDVDAAVFAEIVEAYRPTVMRGAVRHWPAVEAAMSSPEQVSRYLAGFDCGAPVEAFVGSPEIAGRFFYGAGMSGFNFQKRQALMADILAYLVGEGSEEGAPAVYIGAASVPQHLPRFDLQNGVAILAGKQATPRIWIGNRTSISTHYDVSDNLACVVAGRRRFTIFPPDQVANLYVGPLDHTMAGQPTSMVSLRDPDFDRFPRFKKALDAAFVAELEPGDAIYIPTLWWHQVDALAPFNILVNHWWDEGPADAGSPFEALAHGLLTISHLPAPRRDAWSAMFDHYVFRRNGDPAGHLKPEHRGILGTSTPQIRSRMREFLRRAFLRP